MPSIRDVAEQAGVSVSTVSLVLNDKGNISPETRQRVLEIVEQLGYIRSSRARSLRDQQSRVIGYAWDKRRSEFNPVLDNFLYAMLRHAESYGRNLLLFSTENSIEVDMYRDLVASKRVDGFVLSHTVQNDPRFVYLHQSGVPFVAFGRSNTPLDNDVHWVDVDGQSGTHAAAEHLAQHGHRRIGFIGWPEGSVSGDSRWLGYARALRECDIAPDQATEIRTENNIRDGYVAGERLLQAADPPTAVVCVSDVIAAGALRAFAAAGARIAVTGFDDTPIAEFMHPTLTSVRQPVGRAAEVLIDMLLAQLDGQPPTIRQALLQPELIIRESSTV
jgi:DNA-binding LacI/PurR family transcriptional regulator